METEMVRGIGANYVEEVSSETLYRTLAALDKKEDRRKLLLALAGYERKHAELWANILREQGLPLPPGRVIAKHRLFLTLARIFGVGSVLSTIHRDEVDGIKKYNAQALAWKDPAVQRAFQEILPDEISHEIDTLGEARDAAREGGTLRSAVLGANDGIGSVLALSAGVAAATASGFAVLVAGAAALVAGSISMAASNYVSVKAEEEMYARIRAQERGGIAVDRDAKVRQLQATYERRGFTPSEAESIVRRLSTDDEEFTRALLSERHGIGEASFSNPLRLGLITGAAFLLAGAVPLLPFLLMSEVNAILAAVVASAIVLFCTGVFRSMSTLTSLTRGGLEMLGIGLGSAALTYGIGLVIAGAVH
ncbi:MAG TPA: VIT1/CCC1 transporter family protein [Thermoplasmata archaeon]|nr:VIT1/CCC1 transporter family protein [Thermoplasmata archaeon]